MAAGVLAAHACKQQAGNHSIQSSYLAVVSTKGQRQDYMSGAAVTVVNRAKPIDRLFRPRSEPSANAAGARISDFHSANLLRPV
jgi:flagellar basal body rod protein FlgF